MQCKCECKHECKHNGRIKFWSCWILNTLTGFNKTSVMDCKKTSFYAFSVTLRSFFQHYVFCWFFALYFLSFEGPCANGWVSFWLKSTWLFVYQVSFQWYWWVFCLLFFLREKLLYDRKSSVLFLERKEWYFIVWKIGLRTIGIFHHLFEFL